LSFGSIINSLSVGFNWSIGFNWVWLPPITITGSTQLGPPLVTNWVNWVTITGSSTNWVSLGLSLGLGPLGSVSTCLSTVHTGLSIGSIQLGLASIGQLGLGHSGSINWVNQSSLVSLGHCPLSLSAFAFTVFIVIGFNFSISSIGSLTVCPSTGLGPAGSGFNTVRVNGVNNNYQWVNINGFSPSAQSGLSVIGHNWLLGPAQLTSSSSAGQWVNYCPLGSITGPVTAWVGLGQLGSMGPTGHVRPSVRVRLGHRLHTAWVNWVSQQLPPSGSSGSTGHTPSGHWVSPATGSVRPSLGSPVRVRPPIVHRLGRCQLTGLLVSLGLSTIITIIIRPLGPIQLSLSFVINNTGSTGLSNTIRSVIGSIITIGCLSLGHQLGHWPFSLPGSTPSGSINCCPANN